MISLKSPEEIAIMREGGQKLGKILEELLDFSQPGVTLNQIESEANRLIFLSGGTASFKTVADYRWATCLCVNDGIVHGIPTDYMLLDGDNLTIDIGLLYKGFHTDTAWAKIVGKKHDPGKEKFLKTGEDTLWKAIEQAKIGNHIGDISQVIQTGVEGVGFSVVKSLVGHGVGRELHEEPQVPGYTRGKIENTPELIEGMVIAIEIIYAMGRGEAVYAGDDGWTISTRDGSLAAVFEQTLAIQPGGPSVLTRSAK